MTNKNKISVEISREFWTDSMPPIEIRDNKLNLVKRTNTFQSIELDNGIFEISAVLVDGKRHRKILNLQGDGDRKVILGFKPDRLMWDDTDEAESLGSYKVNTKNILLLDFVHGNGVDLFDLMAEKSSVFGQAFTDQNVELVSVEGGEEIRRFISDDDSSFNWVFAPLAKPQSVPSASFRVMDKKIRISLPVTSGDAILGASEVKIIVKDDYFDVNAWIGPAGRKARNMQKLLSSGYILNAAQEARQAEELLFYKYKDPVGAVLGALIMQKIGRLSARSKWVENLAKKFAWLNDGKVLQAMILLENHGEPEKIFSLLSEASRKRMMFTETYSILINILRYWSFSEHKESCNEILESLAITTSSLKWDSVFMCEIDPEGEENA